MRTIKYRQKILDGNGNKSFHYWGFMRNGSFVPPIKSENGTYWTALKDSEQFTGLKDKNGKEIFEGDIVKYLYISEQENKKRQAEVYYDKENCGFFPFYFKQEYDRNVEIRDVEVIGNIYSNPELKEKK